MNAKVAVFIIVGCCANAFADDAPKKPKPKFTIGKETTYVTGPIDKDGFIDYAAALNERLGQGVTAENNANVLFWKAVGPRHYRTLIPTEYFRLMRTEALPEKGDYFVELGQFLKDRLDIQPVRLFEITKQMSNRPWTAKEFPYAAAWLKANEKPLAVLVEASQRSQYFSHLSLKDLESDIGLSGFGSFLDPRI